MDTISSEVHNTATKCDLEKLFILQKQGMVMDAVPMFTWMVQVNTGTSPWKFGNNVIWQKYSFFKNKEWPWMQVPVFAWMVQVNIGTCIHERTFWQKHSFINVFEE
jgi:hypothetical protein